MKMPIENQNSEINPIKNKNKSPKKGKKFYIALSLCLLSVSAAAFSTYKSVKTFITPFQSSPANKNNVKKAKNYNIASENKPVVENSATGKVIDKRKTIPYGNKSDNKLKNGESAEEIQAVVASEDKALVVYPTENNIIKEFSDGKPVYSATFGDWRTHEGTDFKTPFGSPIKSVAGGIVKDIYNDPSYGTTVVIEHDLHFTAYYSGLEENVPIKKGQKVQSNEKIGTLGKIPCEITDEPHLHFSINKDGKFIDPLLILDKEN